MHRLPSWTAVDVEDEACEAAERAAQAAGLPLAAWLSHTIFRSAAAESNPAPHFANYRQRTSLPVRPIEVALEGIRLLSLRVDESEAATAAAIRPLAHKIAELSDKVEQASAHATKHMAPIQRAMERFAARLARLERHRAARRPRRARRCTMRTDPTTTQDQGASR